MAADEALRALLDRHPLLPQDQQSFAVRATHRRVVDAIASGDFLTEWRDVAIRHEEPVTAEDVTDALSIYRKVREDLEDNERALIDMARRRGVSWAEIARRLGLPNGAAAQRRHRWLVDDNAGSWQPLDPKIKKEAE